VGTWGTTSFGNDTACDWAFGLKDTRDLSLVERTIAKVLEAGDSYLEAPEAEEALAAAEVVARLLGNWGERDAYTEPVDDWVERNPLKPSTDLVAKAVAAIDRIVSAPSELLELWQESDDLEAWRLSVLTLRARVAPT
jgi:hypothetical protein